MSRSDRMQIRGEAPRDIEPIRRVTERAFASVRAGDGTEAAIVDALRRGGDLTLSLVADIDGAVIGHVAFSPVTIAGDHNGWFGLGPVSVDPDRQGQGIGSALVHHGLDTLRARGANGCALLGDPSFYARFGFVSNGKLLYGEVNPRVVQHVVFEGKPPAGDLAYARAFDLFDS